LLSILTLAETTKLFVGVPWSLAGKWAGTGASAEEEQKTLEQKSKNNMASPHLY